MNQVLTVSCKLNPSAEQVVKIEAVLKAFADACTWINLSTPEKLTNKTTMQKQVYQQVRELFGLSANLTIRAIARVCANRKTARIKNAVIKSFAPTSIDYDARIFSFKEKDWTVSLTLLHSREHFGVAIGNYQRGLLKGQQPTSATLTKRKDGSFYIQIQVKPFPLTVKESVNCLGVDLGRTDIAHTSTGDQWNGQQLTKVRDHYTKLRATLQQKASKGTRSTRRRCRELLQRLSGKERRFQSHTNHTISYRIIQKALTLGASVALEDLTGIGERTNQQPRNKTERRRSNSWAFYQLRQFLTYKAVKFGVSLVLVNPAYTSQMCHRCSHIHSVKGESYRSGKGFKCGYCGWHGDSDLNGAINISRLGQLVNLPEGSWLACQLQGY